MLPRYTIEEIIGTGAFGHVHRGLDPKGKAVAIKRLDTKKHATVMHEYQILRFLGKGSHIPLVFAYGSDDRHQYMAMELLAEDLLQKTFTFADERLPLELLAVLAVQMIESLSFIHRQGIIHRDVKPSNFMLDHGVVVKLIDFGLATSYLDLSSLAHRPIASDQHFTGSPEWASLNAHTGHRLSRRDDLESLSYTLIHLAGATLPWYDVSGGTQAHRERRITEMKRVCEGESVAADLPVAFGEFFNHSRQLNYDAEPQYQRFKHAFAEIGKVRHPRPVNRHVAEETIDTSPLDPRKCPVIIGQLVNVELSAAQTLAGSGPFRDPCWWDDPSLCQPHWKLHTRPVVVLRIGRNKRLPRWRVSVVPLVYSPDHSPTHQSPPQGSKFLNVDPLQFAAGPNFDWITDTYYQLETVYHLDVDPKTLSEADYRVHASFVESLWSATMMKDAMEYLRGQQRSPSYIRRRERVRSVHRHQNTGVLDAVADISAFEPTRIKECLSVQGLSSDVYRIHKRLATEERLPWTGVIYSSTQGEDDLAHVGDTLPPIEVVWMEVRDADGLVAEFEKWY